jgi:integrase
MYKSYVVPSCASAYTPPATAEALLAELPEFLALRHEPSTRKAYESADRVYSKFCDLYGLPTDSDTSVAAFIMVRAKQGYRGIASTVRHLLQARPGLPKHSDLIAQALTASAKLLGKVTKAKLPLSLDDLRALRQAIRSSARAEPLKLRDWTFYLAGFLGLFRGSELTALKRSEVQILAEHVEIFVARSKTDRFGQGQRVLIARDSRPTHDLGRLLTDLFAAVPSEWVFCQLSGEPVTTDTFRASLKRYLLASPLADQAAHFSLHSLRRGGATAAAQQHVPLRHIKRHGRWKSDACLLYLYVSDGELLAASRALLAAAARPPAV